MVVTNLASDATNATEWSEGPSDRFLPGAVRLKWRTPICVSHTKNLGRFEVKFRFGVHLDGKAWWSLTELVNPLEDVLRMVHVI